MDWTYRNEWYLSRLFIGQGFNDDLRWYEKSNEEIEVSGGDAF